MEREEIARTLYEVRKNLLKVVVIFIAASSIFFAVGANYVVTKIISDLYPAEAVLENRERISAVADELINISATLKNYAAYPSEENRSAALDAAKRLVRLAAMLMTSPILQSPLEGLMLNLKLSMAVGAAATLPYIGRIAYGVLKTRGVVSELRRSALLKYAAVAAMLFCVGVVYGYHMMKFFLRFLYSLAAAQGVVPLYSLSEFVGFIFLMLVLFGFVFELPVLMFFLVKNGFVKYETLRYYRRHIYVAFFVIGAVFTPPDVFTQLMVAIPLVVFFEISMLVIKLSLGRSSRTQR